MRALLALSAYRTPPCANLSCTMRFDGGLIVASMLTLMSRGMAMNRIYAAAALILMAAQPTNAQDSGDWLSWPLADRFTLELEAFFPTLDTKVRFDASDGELGTPIDFEQNLGMSSTETLPAGAFTWRFAKKHKISLEAFALNRSGSSITTTEIRFGDEVFEIALPISSYFDTQVTSLGYSYSLLFDEKKELTLSAGLSVQDIQFGLSGNGGELLEIGTGLTAPLPSFGIAGGYAITDKWITRAGIGYFAFDLSISDSENLSGEIINARASIEHHTFENVRFALSYAYFDVGVDFTDLQRLSAVNYKYHGPTLGIAVSF